MPTLHPQIVQALEAMAKAQLRPIEAMTPTEARAQMEMTAQARKAEPMPVARVEERVIPGPAGDMRVRLYWPSAAAPDACDCLLSRRRPCYRQPRHPRPDRAQFVFGSRRAGRFGRLPDGAGAQIPGGGR